MRTIDKRLRHDRRTQSIDSAAESPSAKTSGFGQAVLTNLRKWDRDRIEAALKRNNWNRQATAAELNINRTTLYKKMRKYRLDVGETN
jgi:transcriptional regulator of acetoin/glycerol metabolism